MTEKTVIFNLSDTSCIITHWLHPIIELVRMCDDAGHQIIISSGRPERARQETVECLEVHDLVYATLLMRPDGSSMSDSELKKAWLDQGVFGPKENILFVVEDSKDIAQMWRDAGLTCLQAVINAKEIA